MNFYYYAGAVVVLVGVNYLRKLLGKQFSKPDVTDENRKYLCISAIFFGNKPNIQHLSNFPLNKYQVKKNLKRDYGIKTKEDAEKAISELSKGKWHSEDYDVQLPQFRESSYYKKLVKRDEKLIKNAKGAQKKMGEENLQKFKDCYTTMAWDLERAGYLVRQSFDAGFITEEEVWHYLKILYKEASETFDDWKEYGTSFYLGRVMFHGSARRQTDNIDVFLAKLLDSRKETIWTRYPLHES